MKKSKSSRRKNINDPEKSEEEKEDNEPNRDDESYIISPPNGGWGWFVVLSAFYINVVADGIQLTFGIFLKPIAEEFHAQYSEVALAGSLMFGIHLLMGPICAGCNRVFGLRPVTIMGSLLCCFGVGVSYFSSAYWVLYVCFGIIGGIGLGLVYMNSLVITSLYFTSLLPVAIAIVVCGTGVGTMTFALLGSFLLRVTSWRNSFLIEAAFAGTMSIAAIVFKPLKPVKVSREDSQHFLPENEEMGGPSSRRVSLYIKADVNQKLSLASILTLQNIAWSIAENMVVAPQTESKKKECQCLKCCKKKKKKSESKDHLELEAVRNEDGSRKPYIEKSTSNSENDNGAMGRRRSSIYYKFTYKKESKKHRNKCCAQMKEAIISMVDCRLLKSYSFFLFTLSGALQVASFLVVFTYEKDRIEYLGISEDLSIYFIIALGGANIFWRLFLGSLALIPKVNPRILSVSTIIIGGIATIASCYGTDIYFQFAFCIFFGLGMAGFAVFRMVLLVDFVGVDFVSIATGINLLFMGIFSIITPPIFGCIKGTTKDDYKIIFGLTGGLTIIAGLMLIRLKKVNIKEIKRRNTVVIS